MSWGRDGDEVEGDLALLSHGGLRLYPLDAELALAAGRLRATAYHRERCAVSMADCVGAVTALRLGEPLATSDRAVAQMLRGRAGRCTGCRTARDAARDRLTAVSRVLRWDGTVSAPESVPRESVSKAIVVSPATEGERLERVVFEIKRVIVGQDRLVERMLVGLLAKGHLLLEGVPGVAKTLAVETVAKVVGGTFSRLQFTPDLVPADILGTRIYRQGREEFDVELGPIVANFVLADEINRAPAKVQSAMLEVMAERHLSIGGKTFPMPDPFLVLATQNPIENEGVYPLPEAQRDRFLFKIIVEYPDVEEEREIVYRMGSEPPVASQVIDPAELSRLQKVASQVFVHHALVDYVVRLVVATRTPGDHGLADVAGWVSYGASPRATLGIVAAARALALIRGRDYVLPQDVLDVAPDVLRHRLVLSYDAVADAVPMDHIISRVLAVVPLPQVTARPQAGPSSQFTAAGAPA